MKIDLGDIFNQLLAAALPAIVQHVQRELTGGNANQPQGLIGGNFAANAPAQLGGGFGTPQPSVQQQYAQQQQQGVTGFGTPPQTPAFGAPTPNQQQVTPDMIQALIMPLIENESTKAQLQAQMNAMGIQNLGDARPDQLPELYARFQQVASQAQNGAGQVQQGGAPSII